MLFFPMSMNLVLLLYVLAAVLPAAFLLRYIYRHDTMEKEPAGLLLLLIFGGVLAALCAGILERIGMWALSFTLDSSSPIYVIVLAFLVVAVAD